MPFMIIRYRNYTHLMQAHFEFICQPAFIYSEFSAELMQEPQCVRVWMGNGSGFWSMLQVRVVILADHTLDEIFVHEGHDEHDESHVLMDDLGLKRVRRNHIPKPSHPIILFLFPAIRLFCLYL